MESVRLTPYEETLARSVARARNARSTSSGNTPAHGAPDNSDNEAALQANIIGARGEIAVARALDLFPNLSLYHEEKDTLDGFDLSHGISVRSARKRFGLLVRPGDDNAGRYVAVVVTDTEILLLGWMDGGEAKDERWLRQPHPPRPACYLVPERELRPVSDLRLVVAQEVVDGIREAAFC